MAWPNIRLRMIAINDNNIERAIPVMVVHLLPGYLRQDQEGDPAGYQGGGVGKMRAGNSRRLRFPRGCGNSVLSHFRRGRSERSVPRAEPFLIEEIFRKNAGIPREKKDSGWYARLTGFSIPGSCP
jgi:hypothetical protein